MRKQKKSIAILLCVLLFIECQFILAESQVETFMGYYRDDSDLVVLSPSLSVKTIINEVNQIGLHLGYEKFERELSDASVQDDPAIDDVSGATTVVGGGDKGFNQSRRELAVDFTRYNQNTTYSGNVFFGNEADFESTALSLAATRDFLNKNFSVTGAYQYLEDAISNPNSVDDATMEHKTTHALTLAISQVLSTRASLYVGVNASRNQGFLSKPSRKIKVEQVFDTGSSTTILDERHPDERLRYVGFAKAKYLFKNDTALDANVSFYSDDWGVTAQTQELRISRYLSKNVIGRLRLRRYHQSAADFYRASYDRVSEEMTADGRLRGFDYHMFGAKIHYYPRLFSDTKVLWSLSVDRYQETNSGVTAFIYQFSTRIPF